MWLHSFIIASIDNAVVMQLYSEYRCFRRSASTRNHLGNLSFNIHFPTWVFANIVIRPKCVLMIRLWCKYNGVVVVVAAGITGLWLGLLWLRLV